MHCPRTQSDEISHGDQKASNMAANNPTCDAIDNLLLVLVTVFCLCEGVTEEREEAGRAWHLLYVRGKVPCCAS